MTIRDKCIKNFWCQGGDVVTRCRKCGFHFRVGIGRQFRERNLVAVECIRCREKEAVPVLKDKKTLAAI